MTAYHFAIGCREEAECLVLKRHYSRRVPGNVQVIGTLHLNGGLFGDFGEAVAACFFSIPPTRWSDDVLELTRLVRNDDLRPPLTQLIGKTVDHIRRKKLADLLVSFADRTHGHHGGIYQAASWVYGGMRDRSVDGCIVDGKFWPGRSCNSRWGTRSPEKLATIIGRPVLPHFDEGKHLYWRAIGRCGERKAARLELERLPYPKPGMAAQSSLG